MRRQMVCQY